MMAVLGLLPAITLAGESSRLTIGGYVPPMQRVVAVQPAAAVDGSSVLVLQEQDNATLGYTVTVEPKAPADSGKHTAVFQLRSDGQPVKLRGNEARLRRLPTSVGDPAATRILEITPAPTSSDAVLILTVASQ